MSLRSLSNEMQKKAERELNEVPERTQDDLNHILEWLEKQPHLTVRTDPQWLISFLRGCKFSLQRAKEKLDYFYTIRALIPEFFSNRDPQLPEIQLYLKSGNLIALPKTEDLVGPRILLMRCEGCNPDTMSLNNWMKLYCMLTDVLMKEDDNCVVSGVILWVDYSKFNSGYLLQYTPSFFKKAFLCMQSAYPVRIKGIYCTHAPGALEATFNFFKTFATEKLQKRLFFYSEATTHKLYDHLPQYLLPKEYGGDAGSLAELAADWRNKIETYRDWYLEDAKYCSNEKLRIGKPKTTAELFGVEGSFRQLTID